MTTERTERRMPSQTSGTDDILSSALVLQSDRNAAA